MTPWHADSDSLLRGLHTTLARATAIPATGAPVPLELLPGSRVEWDETRAPRVSATLLVSVDPSHLDELDPRTGARVRISAGYRRPGGSEDVHPIADLGVRELRVTRRGPTTEVALTAASDEALVIDAAGTVTGTLTAATTAAAVTQILAATISPAPVITVQTTGPAVSVSPVTDWWSTLRDLMERAGMTAYDAGDRSWVIGTRPTATGDPVATVATGTAGTITQLEDTVNRDEWRNYVIYRYRWRDPSTGDQSITATAYISAGPLAITGPAGRRTWDETRDTPTTQAAANAAAADILPRLATPRAAAPAITTAAAWWVRPGHTLTVTTPTTPATRHLVTAVSYDLTAGLMTCRTRLPEPITIATTTPTGGPATPDPTPPASQTHQTTWPASASGTYRANGTKRSDTDEAIQGYYDPSNGNQTGAAVFTAANSTGSETGRTIPAALAGATITKVELRLYAAHWYGSSGTARIGTLTTAGLPATLTTAAPAMESPSWPRATERWLDITAITNPAALAAGQLAVTVGPGNGNGGLYYGRFNGASGQVPPALRITYTRPV